METLSLLTVFVSHSHPGFVATIPDREPALLTSLHELYSIVGTQESVPGTSGASSLGTGLQCKLWILRCVSLLLDQAFFVPVGESLFAIDKTLDLHTLRTLQMGALMSILQLWLDKDIAAQTDHTLVYLGPGSKLIFDLEVCRCLSRRMERACDDPRIDYVRTGLLRFLQSSPKSQAVQNRFLQKYVPATCPSTANNVNGGDAEQDVAVLSLISQVQDIFPELGEGFIEAGLKEYRMDPETLITKILEQSLSPGLQVMDRSMPRKYDFF